MNRALIVGMFAACTSTPSGSTCPPESASRPTYEGFARPFVATYCTGCHSTTSMNRHGAPRDQNYDTEADLKHHADDIDGEAAAGPGATNASMPDLSGPVHAQPSEAERWKLGQFLACEREDH